MYSVSQKSTSPPQKKTKTFCDIFSPDEPVQLKFILVIAQTYKRIPMSTPILVHLSEYLCKMYHFYRRDTPKFEEFNLVCYKIQEFFVKTQVTSDDI